MNYFIIKYPWQKIPNDIFPIVSDPTLKNEVYIFMKKNYISFEETLNIFLKTNNKNNYIGATSLIYFKYYVEFYHFLIDVFENPIKLKKYKKRILKFYKKTLCRWVSFIRYSDDTMYPQNEIFRNMFDLITKSFFKNDKR